MIDERLQETGSQPQHSSVESARLPRWSLALLVVLLAVGAAAFMGLLVQGQTTRAWQIFLVNLLYWPGLAVAGVVLAAIFEVTKARWPIVVRTLAERCAAFLPAAFLFFLATWFGRHTLFPWTHQPHEATETWLNLPFLYGRETAGLLLLYGISLLFAFRSLRNPVAAPPGPGQQESPDPVRRGPPLQKLAVSLLILYAIVYTVFAWDFGMSIQAGWFSTMFGALFFFENLYLGLAAVTLFTVCVCWRYHWSDRRDRNILNNLGKLLLSFSLLWIYLFGSQYLVLWYGNLPHEISFILARTQSDSWKMLALIMLVLNFVMPFLVLLPRSARENPKILLAMAASVLAGMWLERFLLVVPALSPGSQASFGWPELLITAGFFASFATSYWLTFTIIPAPSEDAARR